MILDQAVSLFVVAGAVAVLPGLSRLMRMPPAVMEIIFGIFLGKSFLDLGFSGDWPVLLAHLGFLVLMFYSGMEIDFDLLARQSAKDICIQLAVLAGTFALSLACAWILNKGIFVALVLATTSLGLVMPAIKDAGLSRSKFGQNLLLAASLADFVTLLAITLYVLGHKHGLDWQLFNPLLLFFGFGFLLWAARLWAWWNPERAEALLAAEDANEQGVRLALALLFCMVALSELVHLEPVLGAFMGGCVLSFAMREKEALESKISGLGFGFLIPIFFIHVGMNFDLANVISWSQLKITGLLFVLAFAVKVLPAMLFTWQRMPPAQAFKAGVLLSSRLSLIIAAVTIGRQEGFISAPTKDAFVLLALLTCLTAPTLFKYLHGRKA
ncbi:MAG: cation:proton antiporter [Desulfonatronovibrionaceae bacterium]